MSSCPKVSRSGVCNPRFHARKKSKDLPKISAGFHNRVGVDGVRCDQSQARPLHQYLLSQSPFLFPISDSDGQLDPSWIYTSIHIPPHTCKTSHHTPIQAHTCPHKEIVAVFIIWVLWSRIPTHLKSFTDYLCSYKYFPFLAPGSCSLPFILDAASLWSFLPSSPKSFLLSSPSFKYAEQVRLSHPFL